MESVKEFFKTFVSKADGFYKDTVSKAKEFFNDNKRSPAVIAIAAVLLIVLIVSMVSLVSTLGKYRKAREQYNELSHNYVEEIDAPEATAAPQEDSEDTPSDIPAPEVQPEQPSVISPISVDFNALYDICSDIEGWLFSPGTVINYPVVQCEDNEKYLHGYITGEYSVSGSLFIDYRCARDFADSLTVIYGHHMKDGSMLASICDYKKQEYYDAHPIMYLNTPDGNYLLRLFSAFTTSADADVYKFSFSDNNAFQSYLIKMKSMSDFTCGVNPDNNDHVVMLSTCTYDYDSARYVVFGILEPIG